MTDHDAIVVGVGGVGSAACYHLADRGLDVLGLERFDVPHARGSSHGVTRIIRKAYPDDAYVPLLRAAYDHWRDLERDRGEKLLHVTGSLSAAPDGDDALAATRRTFDEHGVAYDALDGEEVNGRFPAFDLPADYEGVWQPDGGFLACERCTVAHVEGAQARGATVRARERVESWSSTGERVTVETDRGSYSADSLVLAAGAWTPKLVPELDGVLTPHRHATAWFQPEESAAFQPDAFPVFTMTTGDGFYYGLPVHEVPGVKIGGAGEHPEVDPDDADREPSAAAEEPLRAFADDYLPAAAGPTTRLTTGLITWSPDQHFVVDTHPDHSNVAVGAGFSGHGFKFASVLGEILADLAVDGETEHGVEQFRIDRFDASE